MKKLTEEEREVIAREFGEMVVESLFGEGCEAYLYYDGEMGVRQEGSFAEDEEEVIKTIPLGEWHWSQYLHDGELSLEEDKEFIVDEVASEVLEAFAAIDMG